MPDYVRQNERGKVNMGLIGAITAVSLKSDCKDAEAKTFETGARETLDYLANPKSPLNKRHPFILNEYGDTIQKARETFPQEESMHYLQKLLELF
jgi:hypothetical protein